MQPSLALLQFLEKTGHPDAGRCASGLQLFPAVQKLLNNTKNIERLEKEFGDINQWSLEKIIVLSFYNDELDTDYQSCKKRVQKKEVKTFIESCDPSLQLALSFSKERDIDNLIEKSKNIYADDEIFIAIVKSILVNEFNLNAQRTWVKQIISKLQDEENLKLVKALEIIGHKELKSNCVQLLIEDFQNRLPSVIENKSGTEILEAAEYLQYGSLLFRLNENLEQYKKLSAQANDLFAEFINKKNFERRFSGKNQELSNFQISNTPYEPIPNEIDDFENDLQEDTFSEEEIESRTGDVIQLIGNETNLTSLHEKKQSAIKLIKTLRKRGNTKEGYSILCFLNELMPYDQNLLEIAADIAFEVHGHEEALRYRHLIKLTSPKSNSIDKHIAILYSESGEGELAYQHMKNYFRNQKELQTDDYIQMVLVHQMNSRFDDAQQLLNIILKKEPLNDQATMLMGLNYLGRKKLEEARTWMSRATFLNAGNDQGWINLALILRRTGEFDREMEVLHEGLSNNPDSIDLIECIANAFLRRKNPSEALPYLETMMKLKPNQPDYYLKMGNALYEIGNLDGSFHILEKACLKWPDDKKLSLILGRIAQKSGRDIQAANGLENGLFHEKASIEDLLIYFGAVTNHEGIVLESAAVKDRGLSKVWKIIRQFLENGKYYPELELIKTEYKAILGKTDEAGNEFRALLNDPEKRLDSKYIWRVFAGLGNLAEQAGEKETAIGLYKEARKRNPKSFACTRNLIRLFLEAGLKEETEKITLDALQNNVINEENIKQVFEILHQQLSSEDHKIFLGRIKVKTNNQYAILKAYVDLLVQLDESEEAKEVIAKNLGSCISFKKKISLINSLAVLGDKNSSEWYLENSISKNTGPFSLDELILISILYLKLGAFDKALHWCKKANTVCPNDGYINTLQGDIYLNLRDYVNALISYEQAAECDSNNLQIENESIEKVFPEDWIELYKHHTGLSIRKSLVKFKLGEFQQATELLKEIIDDLPDFPIVNFIAALIPFMNLEGELLLKVLGTPEREIKNKTEDNHPDQALLGYRSLQAEWAIEQDRYEDAVKYVFSNAIENSMNPGIMIARAKLFIHDKKWNEAISMLEKVNSLLGKEKNDGIVNLTNSIPVELINVFFEEYKVLASEVSDMLEIMQGKNLEVLPVENYSFTKFLAIKKHVRNMYLVKTLTKLGIKNHLPEINQFVPNIVGEDWYQDLDNTAKKLINKWINRLEILQSGKTLSIKSIASRNLTETDLDYLLVALHETGKLEIAEQMVDRLEQKNIDLVQKSLIYEKNFPEKAIKQSSLAVELFPYDPMTLYVHAQMLDKFNKPHASLNYVNQATDIWKNEPEWMAYGAALARNIGDHQQELDFLYRLFQLDVDNPKNLTVYIDKLNKMSRYDESISSLRKYLHKHRDNGKVWLLLINTFLLKKDFDAAKKHLRQADESAEIDAWEGQLIKARIDSGLGDDDNAILILKKSLDEKQNDLEALLLLSEIYEKQNKFAEALLLLKNIESESKNDFKLKIRIASMMKNTGDHSAVIPYIKEMINDFPEKAEAYILAAEIYLERTEFEQAEIYARKAVELAPNNAKSHIVLGKIKFESGHLDQSVFHYSQAIKVDPKSEDAYIEIIKTHVSRREIDKAVKVAKEGIKNNPQSSKLYLEAGILFRDQKDFRNSKKMLEKAAEINPSDIKTKKALGAVIALNMVHQVQE